MVSDTSFKSHRKLCQVKCSNYATKLSEENKVVFRYDVDVQLDLFESKLNVVQICYNVIFYLNPVGDSKMKCRRTDVTLPLCFFVLSLAHRREKTVFNIKIFKILP